MWHVYIHVYIIRISNLFTETEIGSSLEVLQSFFGLGRLGISVVVSLVTVTVYVCVVNAAPHGWDAPNPTDVSGVEVAVSVAGRW